MTLSKKTNASGYMDEIRCDESSYLIWKWHPNGYQIDNNNRENAIRWGSSLRVKEGEVAVFFYKQKDGTLQDYIVGPYDGIIETKNFPILASIIGLAYDGGTPFQAEIYFINLAQIIQVQFGVPFFDVFDPRFSDVGVPIAVRGTISFKIDDYREFVKLHRLTNFDLDSFQNQIKDAVIRYVKDAVANAPASHNIPVVQIESKISQINDEVEYAISERLKEDFGVCVSGVDIGAIEVDKQSDGYAELMAVTKEMETAKIQAQTEDYVERLRIQREEEQYARHKSTQSANMGAFQVEKQAEVGVAGAEAFGHIGENGTGNVDLGGNDIGFNPATMMAGMAIGGAVGQNIAGTMNGMMMGQTNIPPIPVFEVEYYVAANGQATGPFNMNTLKQMALNGQLDTNSLVWKKGMENWEKAETIKELDVLFENKIPPIPKNTK